MNIKFIGNWQLKFTKVISYAIWLMLVVLVFSVIQNINKVIGTRDQIQAERKKVEKMKQVNSDLEKQITEAQSTSFIEKQVRDRLGLARQGESIVILPDVDTLRKLAPQMGNEENTLPDPNWKKWEKLFF